MKKSLSLSLLLSTLAAPALAQEVEWTYIADQVHDGVVTNGSEFTLVGQVHNNHFQFVLKDDPTRGVFIGSIEPGNVHEIASGSTPRLTMKYSAQGDAHVYYYLAKEIAPNEYQGVGFGPDGLAGDFIIKPKVQAPPANPQPVTISAISASTEYSATYSAQKAIDGIFGNNSANVWFSNSGDANPSLTVDVGSAQQITHYRQSRGYCTGEGWLPVTWVVEGSNDNSTWTVVDTVSTNQAANYPTDSCDKFGPTEQMDSPGNYRYYKFTFTASSLSSVTGVAIGEIEVMK